MPPGRWGERYSPDDVARVLNVTSSLVIKWIKSDWLRAAEPRPGVYKIRRKAIKRALGDVRVLQSLYDAWAKSGKPGLGALR